MSVLAFLLQALSIVAVHDSCSADAAIVAKIKESDPIRVHHAVVGESSACYSVSVDQEGSEVRGYVLDSGLPAVQEFERRRALESRVPFLPVAAPTEKAKPVPLASVAPAFEPWSGIATSGRRMQIAPSAAAVTLVTFWSATSGSARRYVENMERTGSEFTRQGLKSFGLISSPNLERANFYLDDMGINSPQALDRQNLAAKYKADPSKGTTLVIDSSNNVVAVSSNPTEIRAVVARLLSSK